MSNPNLHRMQIFRVVYEMLNISAAARKMGLSQPTVSRHVATLERELQFQLFHNVGGRIEPTWEGHRLYSESEGLFDRISHIATSIDSIRRGAKESLRIISSTALCMSILPAAVGDIHRRMPELDIVIEGGGQRAQIEALRGHVADIAVGGAVPEPIDLRQTVVGEMPLVAVLPKRHPLAGARTFDLAALADHGSVMHNPNAPMGSFIFRELERRRIAPMKYISAFTIPFGIGLARATGLLTVVDLYSAFYFTGDDMTIKPLSESLSVKLVTLEPPMARKRRSTSEFKQALRRSLRDSHAAMRAALTPEADRATLRGASPRASGTAKHSETIF